MFERPDRRHVIANVVFSGTMRELDVDRAALELEWHGYRVNRLPAKLGALLAHPLDDFLEAIIELDGSADDDAMLNAVKAHVDAIVKPYGGMVDQWWMLEPDHEPFDDYFSTEDLGRWRS